MYEAGPALHPVITGVGYYIRTLTVYLACFAWLAHPPACATFGGTYTVELCLIHLHSSATANSRHGHYPIGRSTHMGTDPQGSWENHNILKLLKVGTVVHSSAIVWRC